MVGLLSKSFLFVTRGGTSCFFLPKNFFWFYHNIKAYEMNNSGHDSSEEEWSDVEEEGEVLEHRSVCLFCDQTFELTDEAIKHMTGKHDFNIIRFCHEKKIDFYGYIKLVNYLRANKVESKLARQLESKEFDDEKYFRPVLEDDMLLQIDSELLESSEAKESLDDAEDGKLDSRLKQTEERALRAEQSLARAVDDLNSCKAEMQRLLMQNLGHHNDHKEELQQDDHNSAYFDSYAHFGIHEEMLKDDVRTEAYKKFIMSNANIFKNKVVMDIGCGTGVLSMFAAKAGARLVFAIDQSEIVYQAMDIVRENSLDDVIKVMKCNAEEFSLPNDIEKVDIIISEWMGYFMLFESMLDTILKCRDKFLCSDGMVYPDNCSIYLAAMCDNELWDSKIEFWNDVHGCKMTCMKKYVIRESIIDVVKPSNVISSPAKVIGFDLMKTKIPDLDYETEFELKITKSSQCTGIVGYFDVVFQSAISVPVQLSTSWDTVPTHWKQTIFLFEKKLDVEEGEILSCAIKCNKDPKEPRSLIVKLHIVKQDKSQSIKQLYVIN